MVLKKKFQKLVAFTMSLSLLAAAASPITASAKVNGKAGRTLEEKYGSDTYKNMFLSLYDDVVTKGTENGYLSKDGIPYHAVETVVVEAPDYGHETTSEAMSYLVWIAAMKDNMEGKSGELAKAWKVMETMIPTMQEGFMKKTEPSATYSDEWEQPEKYPTDMAQGNTGLNPIHKNFCSAYGSDNGLYLLHWLADVDDWYGFGGGSGGFTFINTFQRGEQESVFETIPQGCIEELKYGMEGTRGIKGAFSTEAQVAKQYAYTNAPDAEGRAIQAVYWANQWKVGDADVTAKAGKMADELRNDMFDKYYKEIGPKTQKGDSSAGYKGCHYLMSWYTSWGGALDGSWTWQIGCSHSHQFYQNVMQAYAVLNDKGLNSAMKAEGATKDWTESLERQLEFYEWLQSSNGPFAGGCTNSWSGRYLDYPEGVPTFHGMAYVAHPVYADPGSNGWIGNQVWSTQRIAELYYAATNDGNKDIADRCEALLDKWAQWFVDEIKWTYKNEDGVVMPFAIPATLEWGLSSKPDEWTGKKSANSNLTCTIKNYGSGDVGCISSLSNALLYYAKTKGVEPGTDKGGALAIQAYNTAKTLLDCMWACYRDDIGVSYSEDNGSLKRIFEEKVHVPAGYDGKMPNGDAIKSGIKFIDIRSQYSKDPEFQKLEEYYNANKKTAGFELNYHRFWHISDYLMATGTMATLFPDAIPDNTDKYYTLESELKKPSDKEAMKGTGGEGKEDPKETTVTTEEEPAETTTEKPVETTEASKNDDFLYGDIDENGTVEITDLTALSLYLLGDKKLEGNPLKAADVTGNGKVDLADLAHLKQYISLEEGIVLGPKK